MEAYKWLMYLLTAKLQKWNQMLLSLAPLLMQTILTSTFFEIFSGRFFLFDAN